MAPGHIAYRLREGIERFLIPDINNAAASNKAQSEIPVMFDHVTLNTESFNHVPDGPHVCLEVTGGESAGRAPGRGEAEWLLFAAAHDLAHIVRDLRSQI